MTANIRDANARRAMQALQASGTLGRELANTLDANNTRVLVSRSVPGGFTLNFLNTVVISPLKPGASDLEFKAWVSVLGHEASHIMQGYWVDSVEQELNAYSAQLRVCGELGVRLPALQAAFENLDPKSLEHLQTAHRALVSLFPGPTAIVYASLPLVQPVRFDAIRPGAAQVWALAKALFYRPPS